MPIFQNIATFIAGMQTQVATAAIAGGGLLAAFKFIYWHTLLEILGALAAVFFVANIVSNVL